MVYGSKVPSTYVPTYCKGHVLYDSWVKVMVYGDKLEGQWGRQLVSFIQAKVMVYGARPQIQKGFAGSRPIGRGLWGAA